MGGSMSLRRVFSTAVVEFLFLVLFTPITFAQARYPEPVWSYDRYFPTFSRDTVFYAFKISTPLESTAVQRGNWKINQSYETMMSLTIVGMQGIINRYGSRIYLDWVESSGSATYWRNYYSKSFPIQYFDTTHLAVIKFLWGKYASFFNGAVVYDPNVPETINLATMIAGIENRVMIAPQQLAVAGLPDFGNIYDLRSLVVSQGWDSTETSQYKIDLWAYNNLRDKLNCRIIGMISSGPPNSREYYPGSYFALSISQRDYLVALKLPAVYLSPSDSLEASLLMKFMDQSPVPPQITGYYGMDEEKTVTLASRHGGSCPGMTFPGAIYPHNFSFHAGFGESIAQYQPAIDTANILSTLRYKQITTLFCSDGDALGGNLARGYPFFNWDIVQGQDVGWTINTTAIDVIPLVWNTYVKNRTSGISLVSGLSGAGYAIPNAMTNDQLWSYVNFTHTYFRESGLKSIHLDDRAGDFNQSRASIYYEGLKDLGFLGYFYGYGGLPWTPDCNYWNTPYPFVRYKYGISPSNENAMSDSLIAYRANQIFVKLSDYSVGPFGRIVVDPDAIGGKSVLVPVGSGSGLALGSPTMELFQGEYEIRVRLKVPNNSSTTRVVTFAAGDYNNRSRGYASKDIAASDFVYPNSYQEFVLSLTLTQNTTGLGVFLENAAGEDIYVDYFKLVNKTLKDFPNFAALFIPLVVDPSEFAGLGKLPTRVKQRFEQAGGKVLRTDEFLAALNPQYMLEFAKSRYGATKDFVLRATDQFQRGGYFKSLLTVREGMKAELHLATEHTVTFRVDVTDLRASGFNESTDTLEVYGDTSPLDWTRGIRLSKSLSYGHLYEAEVSFIQPAGTGIAYKFRARPAEKYSGAGWETGGNRSYVLSGADSILVSVKPVIQSLSKTLVTFEFNKTITSASDQRLRAVAFQTIYFIDSYGNRVGDSLAIGTTAADPFLGDGWYSLETDQTIGSFRWAGGSGKKATFSLQIPMGAEGIVARIRSAEDSLRMTVTVGGASASVLLVDAYWHSGYIPIGQVIPEPRPNKEPVWTQGLYFPKFPRTDSVYVIRVHTTWGNATGWNLSEEVNWRLRNYNDMTALTLVGMQGIINRYGARVHFDFEDPFHISTSWMPIVKEDVKTKSFDFDGLSAINFLYRRFASYFSGMVIYEPEVPETINLATMYAGVDNAIMVAPGEVGLPGVPQLASVNDLRTLVQQNGWRATIEDQTRIYQWVYDNLWPRLDHRIFGLVSPGPPTSRPFEPGSSQYFSLETIARDYLIALRLPCIYLHPQEEPQKSLLVKFLDASPSPIPITGVFAGWEDGTEQTISEHGDMNIGTTWPEQIFNCGNFSVFASIDVPLAKYVPKMDPQKILKFCSGAPAATMFPTDGDATNYTMQHGYDVFDWRDVQGQNSGWTIASYLWNLALPVWNYYVKSADQISLLSDVNGAGYMQNWCMNDTQIVNYLRYAARYMEISGLDVIHIFEGHNTGFWTGSQAAKYYTYLHNTGYKGSILGYNNNFYRGFGLFYAGSPAPTVRTGYRMHSHNLDWTVNELTARKPGEELYYVSEMHNIQGDLVNQHCQYVNDPDASNGTSTCILKADRNSIFIAMDHMILAPGRYQATFRLKVTENSSPTSIVRIMLTYEGQEHKFTNNTLAMRSILATEFIARGKYQDFTLTFTLDDITTDLRWIVAYDDGSTDLYADNVHIKNLDGTNLPITGTIVIDNLNINERGLLARVPEMFTSKFELKGGVVLNPSEYLAAMNPEYMIEFAKPILGSGDPAIADAQSKLSAGRYLESLLALRTALNQKIAVNPLSPTILTPLKRAVNVSVSPTLTWSSSTGATKYHLQVSKDSLFAVLVTNDSTVSGTSYQLGPLANSMTYYWRVRAKTSTGVGDWSSTWSFTTIVAAPSAPILAAPVDTAKNVSTTPTLSWAKVTGATAYRLQVSVNAAFLSTLVNDSTITDTMKVISPLQNNATFYWRVNAKNDGGTSPWSQVRTFTTIVAAPQAPTLAGPADAAKNVLITPTLSWAKVPGASIYRLQVSLSSTFSTLVVNDSTITDTTKAIGPLQNSTVYYWRVSAKNDGGISNWSGVRSFTTIIAAPQPPSLATPSDTTKNLQLNTTLSWDATGGATLYHLQLSTTSDYTSTVVNDTTLTAPSRAVGPLSLATTYYWRVRAGNEGGWSAFSQTRQFSTIRTTSVEKLGGEIPKEYGLSQNYPNPFNPTTSIQFALPKGCQVSLKVYNLLGKEVATLVSQELGPGYFLVRWRADVPSAAYFYRLQAGEFVETKKMILLR